MKTSVFESSVTKHPAAQAWRELQSSQVETEAVEVLKKGGSTNVYRLVGAGPGRTDVIAKHADVQSVLGEHFIYEELLRDFSLPTLDCYGVVREQGGKQAWLFLEDAGTKPYVPQLEEHRVLAGVWLGHLHTYCPPDAVRARLPEVRFSHYQESLGRACDEIRQRRADTAFSSEQMEVLSDILEQSCRIERCWARVKRLSKGLPRCPIHGDLVSKNMRVKTLAESDALIVLDWETSGWGAPAIDLAQSQDLSGGFSGDPALTTYWEIVRERRPDLSLEIVQRAALAGTLLRCLKGIYWAAINLRFKPLEHRTSNLSIYLKILADSVRAIC